MATFSSQISSHGSPLTRGSWKPLTDSVYEVYKPAAGCMSLEVVFIHGFETEDRNDAFYRTWMKRDESECWLDTWLVECFPQARILCVSYDSSLTSSASTGRQDMYLLGESLARSLIELVGVGQSCPVVLVGHCVGGLVLKEICVWASNFATLESNSGESPYVTFLRYVRGAFFYSTANLGSHIPVRSKSDQGGPLLEHLKLLSDKSARINSEFAALRSLHGWKTFGVMEASETSMLKLLPYLDNMARAHLEMETSSEYLPFVSEAAARADMDEFSSIPGVDHFTICQPDSMTSTSFLFLSTFLNRICKQEIALADYEAQLQLTLQLPLRMIELDGRVKEVIAMLDMESAEPVRLALVGMDGIGKSTLAKQVLLAIRLQFHYTCFVDLEMASDNLKSSELQRLVAENLYHKNGQKVRVNSGSSPWFLLRGKNVLLIVDDVVSEDQISSLLRTNLCREGSRLIITSSRQIWTPDFIVYPVPVLSTTASHRLLEAQVEMSVQKIIPKELISQVVDQCDGLPLTLVVIGRYLHDQKDISVWSGALKRLQTADSLDGDADGNKVWKKLRVSVDTLTDLEEEIFLDVATFDSYGPNKRRYDLNILRSAWREEYDWDLINIGLNNLVRRSLLRVDKDFSGAFVGLSKTTVTIESVYLHKVLRDLGKWISRPFKTKPSSCRSLGQMKDVKDVLTASKEDLEWPRTQVLSVGMEHKKSSADSGCQFTSLPIRWSSIGSLEVLRLLRISNMHMGGSDDDLTFPVNLALLHMENCTRGPQRKRKWALPWWPDTHRWPIQEENVERLRALSVLILENCSPVHLPDHFHTLKRLEILQIHSCGMPMEALPDNFGLLPSLKHLSLNVSLKKLPNSLLHLSLLRSMALSGPYLEALPNPTKVYQYSHLTALTQLDLVNLPALSKLPDSFGEMKSLEYLNLVECSALKELPESFGSLQNLETLTLDGCVELTTLCESFCNLSELRELRLITLSALKMLPKTFGNLLSLDTLDLVECNVVRELPESFVDLQLLRLLDITRCDNLESLWTNPGALVMTCGLTNLLQIAVKECPKFQRLPEFSDQLRSLRYLVVEDCEGLKALPESLGNLTSLEDLSIKHSRSGRLEGCLMRLPAALGHIAGLRNLTLNNCETLPASVWDLSTLQTLSIVGCKELVAIPDSIARLTALQSLEIKTCHSFKEFPNFLGDGTSLTRLEIVDCQEFVRLPESISQLSLLTELIIRSCRNFVGLPECVGQLSSLYELEVSDCEEFVSLPDTIGQLPCLGKLYVEKCENLHNLPYSISHLTSLEDLRILDCKSFEGMLAHLGPLTKLLILGLSSWNNLTPLLESLRGLKSLQSLFIKCMICSESREELDPTEQILARSEEGPGSYFNVEEESRERGIQPFDGCGCLHAKTFLKSLEQSTEEKNIARSLRGEWKFCSYLLSRYDCHCDDQEFMPEWVVSFVCGRTCNRTDDRINYSWNIRFCMYEV